MRAAAGLVAGMPLLVGLASPPLRSAGDQAVTPQQQALLVQADLGRAAPASFRALLWLRTKQQPERGRIEVWRSQDGTLVRFLDPSERGKYLLYRGDGLWFLAPGSKKPVSVPASFRLRGGATLDDLLGRQYSRDYRVLSAQPVPEAPGEVVFELEARSDKAVYARVAYRVQSRPPRPLRVECRLRSGRLATVLEFQEWARSDAPRPTRLTLRDELRGGALTRIEVLEHEERAVPAGLLDLADPSARRELEKASAAEPGPR
jgi:hypothetical protein